MTAQERSVAAQESGSGSTQFPTPAELMGYERCLPGSAARLVRMAEREQQHRHEMEDGSLRLSRRGQVFAFIIALSFLVCSGILITQGHDVAGTIIGSIDLVALVAVFVTGKVMSKNG